jgi:hypothetical protein
MSTQFLLWLILLWLTKDNPVTDRLLKPWGKFIVFLVAAGVSWAAGVPLFK